MHEIFEKYIPKFEYELVSLKEHSIEDLTTYGNLLSLFMILDKMTSPIDLKSALSSLPENYIETLKMNIPEHLKKLLSDVARVLLAKINTPQEEIDEVAEKIYERGVSEMFRIENYDVQETRRTAHEEGKIEGKIEGKLEGRIEGLLEAAIQLMKNGMNLQEVTRMLSLSDTQVKELKKMRLA